MDKGSRSGNTSLAFMEIWSVDKLGLFLLFAIPGFVALKTYSTLLPTGHKDTSQQLLDAVAYSCINYAIFFAPIYFVQENNVASSHPIVYGTFLAFVLLVAPAVWATLYVNLRASSLFQRIAPHPTADAWQFLFSQRERYWVIVTLQDGQKIGGRFDSKSFASSAPAPHQLYLEERWEISEEGGLERPRSGTNGVLIVCSTISSVEFFQYDEEI